MGFGLVQTVAPVAEPLDVTDDLHPWLRIDADDTLQDGVISSLLTSAREYAEEYTQRQLMTATWRLTLDSFPGMWVPDGPYQDDRDWFQWSMIRLPRPPLQSVVSIQYLDPAGVLQTLSPALYTVDMDREKARLRPAYGQIWPVTRVELNAVRITYVAGYASAGAVPERIKQAMKLMIGWGFVNREATAAEWDALHNLLISGSSGGYF